MTIPPVLAAALADDPRYRSGSPLDEIARLEGIIADKDTHIDALLRDQRSLQERIWWLEGALEEILSKARVALR